MVGVGVCPLLATVVVAVSLATHGADAVDVKLRGVTIDALTKSGGLDGVGAGEDSSDWRWRRGSRNEEEEEEDEEGSAYTVMTADAVEQEQGGASRALETLDEATSAAWLVAFGEKNAAAMEEEKEKKKTVEAAEPLKSHIPFKLTNCDPTAAIQVFLMSSQLYSRMLLIIFLTTLMSLPKLFIFS